MSNDSTGLCDGTVAVFVKPAVSAFPQCDFFILMCRSACGQDLGHAHQDGEKENAWPANGSPLT